jgi:hypothetical protein
MRVFTEIRCLPLPSGHHWYVDDVCAQAAIVGVEAKMVVTGSRAAIGTSVSMGFPSTAAPPSWLD